MEQIKKKISLAVLHYLRSLAHHQLKKTNPLIIGITGSAGKTSLMNAAEAVLTERFKVKVSVHANSESGIPLNILGITPRDYSLLDWLRMLLLAPTKLLTSQENYDIYLAEMAIDSPHPPKNMDYLLTIIQPKIGIFLNVLPVHTQHFDELLPMTVVNPRERREGLKKKIAQEKGKLITSLPRNGFAIINFDDPNVRQFINQTKAHVYTFGFDDKAYFQISQIHTGLDKFSFILHENAHKAKLELKNQLLSHHYALTFSAAIALGRSLKIPLEACILGLTNHFYLPPGRMSLLPGIKNTRIIDSSYNASRKTMIDALKTLQQIRKGRKIAVLGDMRELGEEAQIEHEEVAQLAVKVAHEIVTVGSLMKQYFVPKALEFKFPQEKLHSFTNAHQAASKLKRGIIRGGEIILVKGSQNQIFLEIVVEALLQNPEDLHKLCRRGSFWDKQRAKLK